MSFISDLGSGLTNVVSNVNNAVRTVQNVANTVKNFSDALGTGDPFKVVSAIRSINLPAGGEAASKPGPASASLSGDSKDWRAQLECIPLNGKIIFPFTPNIVISGSANYEEQALTHQNYSFFFYQNSRAEQIQITAPFNVEDGVQASYWLSSVHLLRSVTKMYTGNGNPPPLCKFNAYGDFVFKDVPVIVKSFSIDLPQDVNYINTTKVSGGASGGGAGGGGGPKGPFDDVSKVASTVGQLAGLAGSLGANKLANTLGKASLVGGAVAGLGNLLTGSPAAASGGSGPTVVAGETWVPVKSTFNVTLQPVYSRTSVQGFRLKEFADGAYNGRKWV